MGATETTKYWVRTGRDRRPWIIYRTGPDGDYLLSGKHPDWTWDDYADVMGYLTGHSIDMDPLPDDKVDATIAAIRARTVAT